MKDDALCSLNNQTVNLLKHTVDIKKITFSEESVESIERLSKAK